MPSFATAYCLIGSNLGRREDHLRRATFLLADTDGVEPVRTSALYETQPWGNIQQPAFLNVVVVLRTRLDPETLLERFLDIEQRLGRPDAAEREHWGPRTVDLDLLLYDDRVIGTQSLTVPHPHLAERAFALVPLLEVLPEARCPGYPEAPAAGSGGRAISPPSRMLAAPDEPYALALERLGAGERADCHRWGTFASPAGDDAAAPEESALYYSASQEETERLGERFGESLRGAEVVALVGNLGAGKTCLVRGLARGLGIAGPVTSPSYVLVRSYEGRLALHHADFYRLGSIQKDEGQRAKDEGKDEGQREKGESSGAADQEQDATGGVEATERGGERRGPSRADEALELASLGLEDYLDDPGAVVVVEWADHFPAWLEPPYWRIDLTGSGDGLRWLLFRRM
jgi:2-amino-4-hydroxy-6-hydroxymethyldihydropteridine diphosphokinase